jgi:predicted DNA-binding transcriptional regulator AlpA
VQIGAFSLGAFAMSNANEQTDWIRVATLVAKYGISRATIYRKLKDGTLIGSQPAGTRIRLISMESVRRWLSGMPKER